MLLLSLLICMTNTLAVNADTSYRDDEAELSATCLQIGLVTSEKYRFTLIPVKGWANEAESTFANGQELRASDIPMPEGTDGESGNKTIEMQGELDEETGSFGRIRFDKTGWFMYRIIEDIPAKRTPGIKYDETSYYVIVYVVRTDSGIRVSDVTAWHNNKDSNKDLPELSDISRLMDSEQGVTASGQKEYGKAAHGEHDITVPFWNSAEKSTLIVRKNVTGSLGDRTKQFKFRLLITGLIPNAEYTALSDGAIPDKGFDEDFHFVADAKGKATVDFLMADDVSIEFENLTAGSSYYVIESVCNHIGSYEIRERGEVVGTGANQAKNMATIVPKREMKSGVTTEVIFQNDRNIATVTGLRDDEMPYVYFTVVMLIILCAAAVIQLRGRRSEAE